MDSIQRISVIGSGNVGHHLAVALQQAGISVTHIAGRTSTASEKTPNLVHAKGCVVSELPIDQPALICVPDDAIEAVLNELHPEISAAYTSGSVQLDSLPNRTNLGVFYPLQTFTKSHTPDISVVPFFIEANNAMFGSQLLEMAEKLSTNVSYANSDERKKLHLAAVWVNNFTNHILYRAEEYSYQNQVDFKHLLPLLNETILKLNNQSAFDAQTGPARRGDTNIIHAQLDQLEGTPKEIYELMTKSIQETYNSDE